MPFPISQTLLPYIAALIGSWSIGYLLFRWFLYKEWLKEKPFSTLFLCNVSGLVALPILYAIVATDGKTIHTIALPILLLIGIKLYNHKNYSWKFRFNHTQVIALITTALLVYFYKSLPFMHLSDIEHYPTNDYFFYASVSQSLALGCDENIYLAGNFLLPEIYHGNSPYHYTEIWLNVCYAKIFRTSHLSTLQFITLPILTFSVVLGTLALIEYYATIHIKHFFLSFAVLMVAGISLSFYKDITFLHYSDIFSLNLVTNFGDKLAYVYLLTISSLVLWRNSLKQESLFVLMLLPIMSIACLPGTIGGIIFLLFNTKETKEKINLLVSVCFLILSFLFFYHILGSGHGQVDDVNLMEFWGQLVQSPFKNIRTQFNILGGGILQLVVVYLPWLFIVLRLWKYDQKRELIIFWSGSILACLFTWAIFFQLIDAIQFLTACGVVMTNCLIIYLVIEVTFCIRIKSFKQRIINSIGIILPFALSALNPNLLYHFDKPDTYSPKYKNEINKVIQSDAHEHVLIAHYNTSFHDVFSMLTNSASACHFVYNSNKYISFISLNDFDLPLDLYKKDQVSLKRIESIQTGGLLYNYWKKKDGITKNDAQVNLLLEYNVNYLTVIDNSKLPSKIDSIFKLLCRDSLSGEQFYIRNR